MKQHLLPPNLLTLVLALSGVLLLGGCIADLDQFEEDPLDMAQDSAGDPSDTPDADDSGEPDMAADADTPDMGEDILEPDVEGPDMEEPDMDTPDLFVDTDRDGVLDGEDNCPRVANPGQEDLDENGQGDACDEDRDGDGVGDAEDNCPDLSNPGQENFDGDNQGDACDEDDDNDGSLDADDCEPLNRDIHPEAVERCNEVDDNCNEVIDEGENRTGCTPHWPDTDGDHQGAREGSPLCLCAPQGEYTAQNNDDCDDSKGEVYLDAPETCNGEDDNCDGSIDEDWPAVGEACDGADEDMCMDGAWVCSPDGMGVVCSDGPETENAMELCNNSDDDCNGLIDDGQAWSDQLGEACDGEDSDRCANGFYVCSQDGLGVVCQEASGSNREEICNGQDDDCDDRVDEGLGVGNSCDLPTLEGICTRGEIACRSNAPTCVQTVFPQNEICNGLDDDCDGQVDDNGPWPPPASDEPNHASGFNADVPPFQNQVINGRFDNGGSTFHAAMDRDSYRSTQVVSGEYLLCRPNQMTGNMRVDITAYVSEGSLSLQTGSANNLGNQDLMVLDISPRNNLTYVVSVTPRSGVSGCFNYYKLECKLSSSRTW